MMFGPTDSAADSGGHTAQLMAWGIKRFSNDELRQKFIDMTVPQAEALGLTLPDPALAWNEERGHFAHTPVDFTELFEVIAGRGPCNEQRMAHRVGAHRDGDRKSTRLHSSHLCSSRMPSSAFQKIHFY